MALNRVGSEGSGTKRVLRPRHLIQKVFRSNQASDSDDDYFESHPSKKRKSQGGKKDQTPKKSKKTNEEEIDQDPKNEQVTPFSAAQVGFTSYGLNSDLHQMQQPSPKFSPIYEPTMDDIDRRMSEIKRGGIEERVISCIFFPKMY